MSSKTGNFRGDLYYRLNTLSFQLPELRKRREDIPALCRLFLAQNNLSLKKQVGELTPAAYQKLYQHSWPGNIRELKSVIYRGCDFCLGKTMTEILACPETRATIISGNTNLT